MKKLITIFLGLFMVAIAAAYVNEISAPTSYSTSTTTTVNISGAINTSSFTACLHNFTSEVINVTILNKSSYTGAYGILDSSHSLTLNASNQTDSIPFWNFTATFADNNRHWIRLNFTNVTCGDTAGGSLSDVRVIDIDTEYYKLQVGNYGKINFTLNTGLIQVGYGVQYTGRDASVIACSASTRGLLIYNGSGFLGCTADGWGVLNGTRSI